MAGSPCAAMTESVMDWGSEWPSVVLQMVAVVLEDAATAIRLPGRSTVL